MIADMKEGDYDIKELINVTNKSLNQPGLKSLLNPNDVRSLDELKNYLIEKIALMINTNFNQLINSLYRIDIDENKVKEIFYGTIKDNIPTNLASLIIERQLQKLYYRNKYKNGH
ncbi:MAG: hypothetical protein P4L27_11280 [Ignavibacteriaceae bacterium]|nr:hypothetical protein [Ignavibacteriaceae bacterium]